MIDDTAETVDFVTTWYRGDRVIDFESGVTVEAGCQKQFDVIEEETFQTKLGHAGCCRVDPDRGGRKSTPGGTR